MLSLKPIGEDAPLPLSASGGNWLSLGLLGLQLQNFNLCVCHHMAVFSSVSKCLCVSFLLIRALDILDKGPIVLQYEFILTNYICNGPIFK